MKIGLLIVILGCIFGRHVAYSQAHSSTENEERLHQLDFVEPPSKLITIFGEATISSVAIGWLRVTDATSYTVRVYNRSSGILHQEIQNVLVSFYNITGLESGSEYAVTVSAVFAGRRGRVETPESDPHYIHTVRECAGGQVRTQCSAHCVSTCDNPDPICSRICVSGCACPRAFPIWDEGLCIPRQLCPAIEGKPLTPRNLEVLPSIGTGDILLAWEAVEDATFYTIRVKLASDRSEVIRTLETKTTAILIPDLDVGQIYIFSVKANMRKQPNIAGRSALLPPSGRLVSKVTESGFTVSWLSTNKATRYAFRLYDESRENVLYSNEQIGGNSIKVDGLAPGTIYYYSVATAGAQKKPGIFSELRGVRTKGTPAEDLDAYHSAEVVKNLAPSTVAPPTTTTTTTAPPTTTAMPTTTPPLTECHQRYASAVRFYENRISDEEGPSFPHCDEQGLFVTVQCSSEDPDACWCVDPMHGDKFIGSDFGGDNSAILLNCDKFGSFSVDPIDVQVDQIKSTSVRVQWSNVPNAEGYVLVMENEEEREIRTMSMGHNVQSHMVTDLISGQTYIIGIFAVDNQGWASSISNTEVTTDIIDTPENLRITESSADSVTISWDRSPTARYYAVRLINAESGQLVRRISGITSTTFTIFDLDTSVEYVIEVRAKKRVVDANSIARSHASDPASVDFVAQKCIPSRPLDLLYVVDTSREPTWHGLQHEKSFFINITSSVPELDLRTGTRVAAVRSFRSATPIFHFTRYSKANNVSDALKELRYNGSPLNTATTLDYVRTRFFEDENRFPSHKIRQGALSVTIVIYSGNSVESVDSIRQAAASLNAVTNVIAVGIDRQSEDEALSAIASRPDLIFKVSSFDALGSVVDPILQKLCSFN